MKLFITIEIDASRSPMSVARELITVAYRLAQITNCRTLESQEVLDCSGNTVGHFEIKEDGA